MTIENINSIENMAPEITSVASSKSEGIDGDDSDVEMEGMDLENDDDDDDDDDAIDAELPGGNTDANMDTKNSQPEVSEKLATEDQDELEAVHRERMELMVVEQKKVADPTASAEEKLQHILGQSEVFAHFLAGTVAASEKKRGKKGSRGTPGTLRHFIKAHYKRPICTPSCSLYNGELAPTSFFQSLRIESLVPVSAIKAALTVTFQKANFGSQMQ